MLARNLIDKDSGEFIANANDEITPELLEAIKESGITKLELIYFNDVNQGHLFPKHWR